VERVAAGAAGTHPYYGCVTRHGVSTADPMIVLCYMTGIFDAAFLAGDVFAATRPLRAASAKTNGARWPFASKVTLA